MGFSEFNFIAILIAAASAFAIGGLWYSQLLFGKQWMAETGMTAEKAGQADMKKVMGGAFALNFLAALVFAMFLGPAPKLLFATGAGFAAGAFWVATSLGVQYLFEQRSLKLFLINGGYVTLQFTVFGLILGLVH